MKSQWSTRFSRIENMWPRDGSCPLPLRSKIFINKCFRIVKAQKISRGDSAHVMGSPFAPNEVPAPVYAAALTKKVDITSGRLMKFSRYVPHKRKIPPTQRSDDFVGVNRRQNESGVLRGGKSSQEIKPHRIVSLQKSLWICWE